MSCVLQVSEAMGNYVTMMAIIRYKDEIMLSNGVLA